MVTTPKSVDAAYYRELLTGRDGVFDKIKEKFPHLKGKPIIIQQDGAKPHNGLGNEAFIRDAGIADGWKIIMLTQPAQSPDLNILDLAIFASLKRQQDIAVGRPGTIDQLIKKIEKVWKDYPSNSITKAYAHLFANYNCILKHNGDNKYRQPHTGVSRRENRGERIIDLSIDVEEYNRVTMLMPTL